MRLRSALVDYDAGVPQIGSIYLILPCYPLFVTFDVPKEEILLLH